MINLCFFLFDSQFQINFKSQLNPQMNEKLMITVTIMLTFKMNENNYSYDSKIKEDFCISINNKIMIFDLTFQQSLAIRCRSIEITLSSFIKLSFLTQKDNFHRQPSAINASFTKNEILWLCENCRFECVQYIETELFSIRVVNFKNPSSQVS